MNVEKRCIWWVLSSCFGVALYHIRGAGLVLPEIHRPPQYYTEELQEDISRQHPAVLPKTNTFDMQSPSDDDDSPWYSDSSLSSILEKLEHHSWKVHPLQNWCVNATFLAEKNSTTTEGSKRRIDEGFLLVKVPKSASSTAAGVALQLQYLYGCSIEWTHRLAAESYALRHHPTSFMVAPIREPHTRALSSVYFHKVSFHGVKGQTPKDRFIIEELNQTKSNFISHYTSTRPVPVLPSRNAEVQQQQQHTFEADIVLDVIRSILQTYDFLLVVERLEESLVVLAWILNISLGDLVTLSSKQAGSYYRSGKRCIMLAKPVASPEVTRFLQSDYWKEQHGLDRLLHMVANASLDHTITQIGRDRFHDNLTEFRRLMSLAEQKCASRALYPCGLDGQDQLELSKSSCYARDFGCGYRCVVDTVSSSK